MRHIYRTAVLVIAVLILFTSSIFPIEQKLKLGKDLRGGVSLIYAVQIKAGEDAAEVLDKTIDVLKNRVNPDGTLDVTFVAQGNDRIEITMPLPGERVKRLRMAVEEELARLGRIALSEASLDRMLGMSPEERAPRIEELSGGDPRRRELLEIAARTFDEAQARRAEVRRAMAEGSPQEAIERLVEEAGEAVTRSDKARADVLRTVVSAAELARVLNLSTRERTLQDPSAPNPADRVVRVPSPRERGLERLIRDHPDAAGDIRRIRDLHDVYLSQRTTLDDPQDLIRILRGAGVLTFRIAVEPSTTASAYAHPEEERLRGELRARGPRNVRAFDAKWCKINQIENWYSDVQQLRALEAAPQAFFEARGYVGEEYDGEYYLLLWDTRQLRLSPAEGQWGVARSFETSDSYGRPAIGFEMDARGGQLLGNLTREPARTNAKMAVLLDDEVYTAPRLNSAISRSGIIEGDFSPEERNYIIRVLKAGSLQAKLSPEPLSISSIGPQLGADNLRRGLEAGIISMLIVSGFMIVYYFGSGMVAVIALTVNAILLLGAMSLARASFTLPGIAGVILTFGQAVDSNVLIYERMREEFHRGADMKTAVRLGFARAFSPIMDGNISNLIVCAVLYWFGTQEIRGFALTLGIGVVTTLFAALVVSRLIFTVLVDKIGWSRTSQLPMAIPMIQRLLTPSIDWMKYRVVLFGGLMVVLAASSVFIFERGQKFLGTEFRGGIEVEIQFREDEQTGKRVTLVRREVQERLVNLGTKAAPGDDLRVLINAEALPVNATDGVTSDRFRIRTTPADDKVILAAIANLFEAEMESRGALSFVGAGSDDWRDHVLEYRTAVLGENIERPELRTELPGYIGGAAVMLRNLDPPPTLESLISRLDLTRQTPEFADTLARAREVRIVEGDERDVITAVLVVRDDNASFIADHDAWEREVAAREWRLVNEALTQTSQLASVQTFSPAIAKTFVAKAVTAAVLSLLLLIIYVWVRFGTARWAVVAVFPLFADVVGIAGLVGFANFLYENPATNGFARSIGLLPFKFDLAQVAALLTIVGYSLNDKIIILDRVRENRGKMNYASYTIINDAINQTLSRTVITSGTTLLTTAILYCYGGEAVRGFAFSFNLGVILGTYTSLVSSPLIWSKAKDVKYHERMRELRGVA